MKKITFFILISILIGISTNVNSQGVAINTDGSSADASAMLDVSSTDKGMLIPRMTAAERIVLPSKVQGLIVYQTNATQGFYYYNGSSWNFLLNNTYNSSISDTDGDTKVQVEESANEDIIRFDMGGTEYFNMQNGRFNILNTGKSVFIGEGAGENANLLNRQNVFVGYQAGKTNTLGMINTAIGYGALYSNLEGEKNTAIGHSSLFNNGGNNNTATGYKALYSTINGIRNTAIGSHALEYCEGSYNTALGYNSLYQNTSGEKNVGIGLCANQYNQEGSNNTIIGYYAGSGSSLHNKSGNIFLGYSAGKDETGDNKLYIQNSSSSTPLIYGDFDTELIRINGELELNNDASPSSLKFFEPSASGSDYTKFQSQAQATAITYTLPASAGTNGQVLQTSNTSVLSWVSPSSGDITAVGSMTSGDVFAGTSADNQWLGMGAAAGRIEFDNQTIDEVNILNAYVGIGTSVPLAQLHIESDGDAEIIIDADADNAGGEDDNPRLELRQDGESVIGAFGYIGSAGSLYTGSTQNSLYVMNEYNSPLIFGANSTIDLTIQSDGDVVINSLGTGTVYSNSGRLTNVNPSDKRLKENIEDLSMSLNEVMKLRPVTFNWKNTGNQSMGFIAQEVERVIPELVGTNEDGSKGVYSTEMIPYMVKAMQEQQEMIDALLQQNKELKKRMEKLENGF